jgi:hypothetical protein
MLVTENVPPAARLGTEWAPSPLPAFIVATLVVRVFRMARNVALLASVALIAAVTLLPRGGDGLVQVSQLGDIVEALRRSDKPFLLDSLLEAGANILLFLPLGAALWLRGFSIATTASSVSSCRRSWRLRSGSSYPGAQRRSMT